MNKEFQKKHYDLEEVRKLWQQEPNDKNVFKAANQDIDEYPPEIQNIIKEEAERRRTIQANTKPIPKKTIFQKLCSGLGFSAPKNIDDLESAQKLIENAVGMAIVYTSIGLVAATVLTYRSIFFPFVFIEGIVAFTIIYGIHKKNRTCAVFFFTYFVLAIILKGIMMENITYGMYLTFFTFLLFGRQIAGSVRGTFAYHRLRSKDNTTKKEIEKQDSDEKLK